MMGLSMAVEPDPMVEPNENESSPATGVTFRPNVQVELLVVTVEDP